MTNSSHPQPSVTSRTRFWQVNCSFGHQDTSLSTTSHFYPFKRIFHQVIITVDLYEPLQRLSGSTYAFSDPHFHFLAHTFIPHPSTPFSSFPSHFWTHSLVLKCIYTFVTPTTRFQPPLHDSDALNVSYCVFSLIFDLFSVLLRVFSCFSLLSTIPEPHRTPCSRFTDPPPIFEIYRLFFRFITHFQPFFDYFYLFLFIYNWFISYIYDYQPVFNYYRRNFVFTRIFDLLSPISTHFWTILTNFRLYSTTFNHFWPFLLIFAHL